MITKPRRLRAVPRLAGKIGFKYRFDVASQVMAAGAQDIHVQVIVPLSGPGQGQIGVRVGRLLVYPTGKRWARSWMPGDKQEPLLTRPLAICHCREWVSPSKPTRSGGAPAASRGPSSRTGFRNLAR